MNRRTASTWSGAYYYYIYSLVTGIGCCCITKYHCRRAIDGRIGRTGNRRSGNITHGDRSAAGSRISTVICCTEDAGMNCRTASAWCSAYYHYIHALVAGIAGCCTAPGWSCRAVDRLVRRTSDGRSRDVTYRNGSAASACVATVIGSSPGTGMNRRTSSARRCAYYDYIHSLVTGVGCRCSTP